MHDTALEVGRVFFESYLGSNVDSVLEVGSRNVNGALRDVCPRSICYTGVDKYPGLGVDVLLNEDGTLPFADETFDIVVSSSCLEHDQFFWLTFLEMLRVVRKGGFIYLNAPSNGKYHEFPYDNWRFYPDAGLALQAWGRYSGREVTLIESFILPRAGDVWNDFVAVFARVSDPLPQGALVSAKLDRVFNLRRFGCGEVEHQVEASEDMQIQTHLREQLQRKEEELVTLRDELARAQRILARVRQAQEENIAGVKSAVDRLEACTRGIDQTG